MRVATLPSPKKLLRLGTPDEGRLKVKVKMLD
jgi:hypothetical protein